MSSRPRSLVRSTARRRAALTALETDIDESVWAERRQAVRALLSQPLCFEPGSARTLIRRHRDWLQLWFSHHPGWELSVDAEACRLVKRPPHTADSSRPALDSKSRLPVSRRAYIFVCLILGILVREGRQMTLKNLAERLAAARADPHFEKHGVPLDLDRREVRRDLVHALRLLLGWNVLARVDGSEDGYIASESIDVLYQINRPILTRLLSARQPPSLVATSDFEKRLDAMWRGVADDSEEGRNRAIRHTLFRRLLDDPVLYYHQLAEDELGYLDKQRSFILAEICRATGMIAEVRAEGIAMVDLGTDISDFSLPEEGTDGHLTLLLATWLAGKLRDGETHPIPLISLASETARLIGIHKKHWRKDVTEPGRDLLMSRDVADRLCALGLAEAAGTRDAPALRALPAIARFALREKTEPPESDDESSDLFGRA